MSNTLLDDRSNDKSLALTYLTGYLSEYEDDSLHTLGRYSLTNNNCPISNLKITNDFSIDTFSLTSSTIENMDFSKCVKLNSYAFFMTTGPQEINLSNPNLIDIPTDCFESSTKIEKIILPYVKQVGNAAFKDCKHLKYLDLGSKIQTLNSSNYPIFYGCSNLNTIIIRNEDAVVSVLLTKDGKVTNGRIFADGYNFIGSIYVPDSLVDSYKDDTVWSDYSTRITGLSTLQEES